MGYIQIDRNISNNWIWQKTPFSYGQAWIDLLLLANYKENKRIKNNEIVISNRGEVNLSILYLSNKWGWDRKKTTRFLELLERDNMVELNKSKNGTTIRITNYNIYQQNQVDTKQKMGQQKDNEWDNNSPYINKENKEINNIYKESISKDIPKKVETKYFESLKVNTLFNEFLELRKKIKAVNSERAINTLINKLKNYDEDTQYKMIENSIVNSWKDVYELKEQKRKDNVLDTLREIYNE
jgi:hypothetical protein